MALVSAYLLGLCQTLCYGFRATFPIDGGRNDTSCIPRPFTTGIEARIGGALQRFRLTQDTHRSRCACFRCKHHGVSAQETPAAFPELFEGALQTRRKESGKPEVDGRGDCARRITHIGQCGAEPAVYKVCHALRGSSLSASALHPRHMLHGLLQSHDAQGIIGGGHFGFAKREKVLESRHIVRQCLHHHTAVAPPATPCSGAHAVHHHLASGSGGRDYHTTRTHTETIDATSALTSQKTILCSR